ncbi:COX15/CtaA family protein [Methylocystis sp. IM3]|jgi:cytochrome c oxidase assembly protein subunit 15|uniref:COX15/CtaA family protein n=1 Tax=unclassified Methylocystis TaxID=2625913 RepID=UPI000FA15229|nr:MAG: heme A synthase [Hyphomicrobiales bacterium]
MEDWLLFPHPVAEVRRHATEENAVAVRNWLWLVAALVLLMVLVGGATRLTESGLSIVEWKPVTGVIPPLSQKEWLQAFEDYKKIPQYKELFPDMDLAGFKYIYAWEWAHRLLGRLIGVVFAFPLIWFWVTKQLPASVKPKLIGILALGALQGGVGWWMVSSGLIHRTEVAQERLAIHLVIAALIFAACLWVAGGLGPRKASSVHDGAGRLRATALAILALVFLQLFMGGIVAGLRAGLVENTWPLIAGAFIPPADVLWPNEPWWSNIVDTPLTAQFFHRMIAYVIFIVAAIHLVDAAMNAGGAARKGAVLLFGHVVGQIALGVATLLLIEPPFAGTPHLLLALAHQALGMGVLAVATLQARRLVGDLETI